MLFNELQFWSFFGIVAGLYFLLPHRGQNLMLLVASYVFYGSWDWRFLSLIFLSTCVDYWVGSRLGIESDDKRRKALLALSVSVNLGLLGVFKYFGFFVVSFQALLETAGIHSEPWILSIVLPVGISFYTFQTMSYTIDIYRGRLKPTDRFLDFALFVAFFPQLVAGPIERAASLLPNVTQPRNVALDDVARGAMLCLVGLIKKIVIADAVAPSVNAVYASSDPTRADVILATWLFAVQIYCDFSGYTDIARGTARILGFRLMRNFAQPYFAADPQEFWRRWHISLSTWLRDYLYVPLGGNRHGERRTYRNLMLTMTLGGLWHGAAWNFIAWGVYQGILLAVHRAIWGRHKSSGEGNRRDVLGWLARIAAIGLFFQVVCYGWLLFRATSFAQISDFTLRLIGAIPTGVGVTLPAPPFAALLGIAFLVVWDIQVERMGHPRFYDAYPRLLRAALIAAMIYLLAFGATSAPSEFIYFQF